MSALLESKVPAIRADNRVAFVNENRPDCTLHRLRVEPGIAAVNWANKGKRFFEGLRYTCAWMDVLDGRISWNFAADN